MESHPAIFQAAIVGVGATALMDLWLLLLKRTGVPAYRPWTSRCSVVGSATCSTAASRTRPSGARHPLPPSLGLGWLTHYAVGIAFAAILVALQGSSWLVNPSLLPALTWGLATASAPLFVLQPAMGAGIASLLTPTPLKNSLRSLANHAVFGLGLYLSAAALTRLAA